MTGPALVLDLLLAATLIGVALTAVLRRDLLEAVMLLFAFGLVLALVWARLGAPDVAMVEAALGAGITGVLFLAALARAGFADEERRRGALRWLGLALLCAGAVAPVAVAVARLPAEFPGLIGPVMREVPVSGASHPVTSVLLNFRGYDTLLEIAVLLLAVLGAWAARGPGGGRPLPAPHPGPVLAGTVRLLLPVMVVVAGVLLWVGARAPGGAFQAGTVLGTVLVLASLSGVVPLPRVRPWVFRATLALGFAVFLAIAGGAMLAGGSLLEYPRAAAAGLLLAIEAALTLSIALVMAALFEGEGA